MPTSSNRWTSLLRSAAVVLALKVAGALGGYAFVWVAVRHFGHEGYGRFELAFTFLSILAVVAKWGYDGVLLRELPGQTLQQNKSLTWGGNGLFCTGFSGLSTGSFYDERPHGHALSHAWFGAGDCMDGLGFSALDPLSSLGRAP